MPYQEIGDLSVYYEEFGAGKPVLFLHSAYSRGLLAFCGQIQPFYSAGWRCLYPDFRGHGRTRCRDLTWDSERIAEDMILLLDRLNIEKANLIGYSTGGGVAYYMAARHPERVQSLISIGNGGVADAAGAEDFTPEALASRKETDFIEKVKSLHADAHQGDWETYLLQEVRDWCAHPLLTQEEWSRLVMPMLLIAGEKDEYASAQRLEQIRKSCPQAEVWIVKDCGHRPHFPQERVREVNERMLQFLAANG